VHEKLKHERKKSQCFGAIAARGTLGLGYLALPVSFQAFFFCSTAIRKFSIKPILCLIVIFLDYTLMINYRDSKNGHVKVLAPTLFTDGVFPHRQHFGSIMLVYGINLLQHRPMPPGL